MDNAAKLSCVLDVVLCCVELETLSSAVWHVTSALC